MTAEARVVSACEQDDHDRVWQAGREAGFRDALIALAENRDGAFFDELDRNIADSLRRDQEYIAAHDAKVLDDAAGSHREALRAIRAEGALQSAEDKLARLLRMADTWAEQGATPRDPAVYAEAIRVVILP